MGKKTSKDKNTISWVEVWSELLAAEKDPEELYQQYNECTDSKENYGLYYREFMKRTSVPAGGVYAIAGELWQYLDYMNSSNHFEDNNQIAEALLHLLEKNKRWMQGEKNPELKYRMLELCCDIFIAGCKKHALTYMAILYDLLVDQYIEAEESDEFYTPDALDYLISAVRRKWFNTDRFSSNLKDNVYILESALHSQKSYVRSFASYLATDLAECTRKIAESRERKKLFKKAAAAFAGGLVLGGILASLVWGIIGKVDKADGEKENEIVMDSETPTPTPDITITEAPTPTVTVTLTPTPTQSQTEQVTPDPTGAPVIGNDPESTTEELNLGDSDIRLNVAGKLNVEGRYVRTAIGEKNDTDQKLQQGEEVIPVRVVQADEELGGYWYEVQCPSLESNDGVTYYMWFNDGDLIYE